jgi:hypothetical protein
LTKPAPPWRARLAECFGAGLFLAYAGLLFAHASAPSMTDYANWTYQGVLLARHLHGLADPAHALKHYPVPNSAATLGIGLLTLLLPWMAAAKTWLCLQMLISFLALRHLSRTLRAHVAVWFFAPQAIFLGVNWWYGFVNFELGLAWVLLMASLLLRSGRGERGHDGILGVLLVVAFFTHMIPFAFCCLLLLLFAAQTGRWRVLWQAVPAMLLSVWYVAGRYLVGGDADGRAGMVGSVRNYSAAFWAYKANSYAKSFGFVNPSGSGGSVAIAIFGKGVFVLLLAASAALCAVIAWRMILSALGSVHSRDEDRFLWISILLLLPLYLFAPATALGVSDPGSRLLEVALALALLLACRAGATLPRFVVAGCGAILSLAGVFLFAWAGFGPQERGATFTQLPHAVSEFAHVPNHDQDYFYKALERGDSGESVFPTGMLLNRLPSRLPELPPK